MGLDGNLTNFRKIRTHELATKPRINYFLLVVYFSHD